MRIIHQKHEASAAGAVNKRRDRAAHEVGQIVHRPGSAMVDRQYGRQSPQRKRPRRPRPGDMNGDGIFDLVISGAAIPSFPGDQVTEVFLSDGRGGFHLELAAGVGGQGVAVADLNGDGLSDLALASNFQLDVLLNKTIPPGPTLTSLLPSSTSARMASS